MKNEYVNFFFVLSIFCSLGLTCKGLSSSNAISNSTTPQASPAGANMSPEKKNDTTTAKTIDDPGLEKPDFTVSAEDLDKEFTRDGVTTKDLQKYAKKNIAVSGRVSMLVLEKKGTVEPWVTLYAPGVLRGVSCYFDDKNVDQLKLLKEDRMAKVQGFQDDFIVPKVSPRLTHCVVIEAK